MNLVDPITIGSAVAPSRVMFGPHETNLGRRRAFSERHVAYYHRRAVGGAGIVVTETASVHPVGLAVRAGAAGERVGRRVGAGGGGVSRRGRARRRVDRARR